jgi:hypothetical protein
VISFNVFNDEVEVDRCPMTIVIAPQSHSAGGRRAGSLDEQIDRHRASQHLDAVRAKPTTDLQPEGRFVEVSRLVEIIHINVYQDLHWPHPRCATRSFSTRNNAINVSVLEILEMPP